MWCCVVLCCVVLCCVVLCGVVLCCVVLCCVLCCVVLLFGVVVLCCVVLCCVVLCCVVLCCVVLCCVVLCCVVLWCCGVVVLLLCCVVLWWCVVVMWCDVLWCVVVWCGLIILKSVPDLNKLSSLVMVTLIFAYFWDSLMASIKHSFSLKILPTWLLPHVWWFDNIHAASSWCAFPRRRTKGKGSSAIAKRSVITLWNSSELFSSTVFSHRTPLSVLIVQHRK